MHLRTARIAICLAALCGSAIAGVYPEMDFVARGRIVSVNVQNKEMVLRNVTVYRGEGKGPERNPLAKPIHKAATLKIVNAVDSPEHFYSVYFIHYRENPVYEGNVDGAGGEAKLADFVAGDEVWVFSRRWTEGSTVFESEAIMPITYDDEIFGVALKGDMPRLKKMLGKVNDTDQDGATPLHHAVAGGHGAAVDLLIASKANVNAKKKDGVTPLHVAAALGRVEIAKTLIANGADVKAVDQKGRTPLSVAKARKQTAMAKFLTGKAQLGQKSSDSGNKLQSLFDAMQAGDEAQFNKIIKADPQLVSASSARGKFLDGTLTDKYGPFENVTPLHVAANCGRIEMMKLLLEKGADVEAQEKYRTPLSWAVASNQVAAAQLLISKGCRVDGEVLHEAAWHGHTDVMQSLLKTATDVDARDHAGRTPLGTAAQEGHASIVSLLIEKGASVNATVTLPDGGKPLTPLGVALECRHSDVADILRAHGGKE